MDEPGRSNPDYAQAPLILRRMPPDRQHLARAMTGDSIGSPAEIWWELVDAAAAADLPPAGVVLTRRDADGRVTLSAVTARHDDAPQALPDLLRMLTAALRGHAADLVVARSTDPVVVTALLAVGFVLADDGYELVL